VQNFAIIIYIIAIFNKNLLKEFNCNVFTTLCENVMYDVTCNGRVCYTVEQEINNLFNSYEREQEEEEEEEEEEIVKREER